MTNASIFKIYQDIYTAKNHLLTAVDGLIERGESMESLAKKAKEIELMSEDLLRKSAAVATTSRLKKGAIGLAFVSICTVICYLIFLT